MTSGANEIRRRMFLKKGLAGLAAVGAVPAAVKTAVLGAAENPQAAAGGAPAGGKPIVRTLGRTGLKVPVVSMGVMNADNPAVVQAALETGIILLDTAHGYQRGRNEQMIGQVIKGRPRDSYMIATKVPGPQRERSMQGLDPEALEKAFLEKFDISLGRLGLEHVEILYLHNNSTREDVQNPGILSALQKVKKSGKARFVGTTTHSNEPAVIRATVEAKVYDVVLTAYNFRQDYREEVRKAVGEAAAAGLGIVAMKTQAGVFWDKQKKKPIDMKAALRWALRDPNVHTAVPGFTTFDQLQDDLVVLREPAFTPADEEKLGHQKLAGFFCQGCEECLPPCPQHLPIPELMRSYMYGYAYRNREAAQTLLASLDLPRLPCGDCDDCQVVCAKGFDVRERIRDIVRLRDVPRELLI